MTAPSEPIFYRIVPNGTELKVLIYDRKAYYERERIIECLHAPDVVRALAAVYHKYPDAREDTP